MTLISTQRPILSGERFDLADYINPRALESVTGMRFDAAQVAFSLRELTDIYARTFDFKFPDLKIRQILPIYTGVDPGAEGFLWKQYNQVGTAKIIDSYAADLPESDAFMAEFQSRCYSLGTSYSYSMQDLRRSRMAGGEPLESRKARAARRSMEQAVEQIGFFGIQQVPGTSVTQGLFAAPTAVSTTDQLYAFGLTNFPGLTVATTTNDWTLSSTSIATIVDDFNTQVASVRTNTKGVHSVNSVVFPLSIWTKLNLKPRSTTFTEDTLLRYLLKLNPEITNVYWTPMTETAGLKQDASTPGPRIMFFERNEENIQLVEPQPFEQLPPQMVNMTVKVPCHQRIAGVRVSYPLAFVALDGAGG